MMGKGTGGCPRALNALQAQAVLERTRDVELFLRAGEACSENEGKHLLMEEILNECQCKYDAPPANYDPESFLTDSMLSFVCMSSKEIYQSNWDKITKAQHPSTKDISPYI